MIVMDVVLGDPERKCIVSEVASVETVGSLNRFVSACPVPRNLYAN